MLNRERICPQAAGALCCGWRAGPRGRCCWSTAGLSSLHGWPGSSSRRKTPPPLSSLLSLLCAPLTVTGGCRGVFDVRVAQVHCGGRGCGASKAGGEHAAEGCAAEDGHTGLASRALAQRYLRRGAPGDDPSDPAASRAARPTEAFVLRAGHAAVAGRRQGATSALPALAEVQRREADRR